MSLTRDELNRIDDCRNKTWAVEMVLGNKGLHIEEYKCIAKALKKNWEFRTKGGIK